MQESTHLGGGGGGFGLKTRCFLAWGTHDSIWNISFVSWTHQLDTGMMKDIPLKPQVGTGNPTIYAGFDTSKRWWVRLLKHHLYGLVGVSWEPVISSVRIGMFFLQRDLGFTTFSWEKHSQLVYWFCRHDQIFTPTWGNDPIWLIFLKWVETTN